MSAEFYVRQSKTDPDEWVVWGPMGDAPGGLREFTGRVAGFSSPTGALEEASYRNKSYRIHPIFVDLTKRCPTCGSRADMCFSHGEDWKKR